ncbi:unnamed protein product, partial [marine sediment metagenome]
EGESSPEEVILAACLAARYCDHYGEAPLMMRVIRSGEESMVAAIPLTPDDPRISSWRINGARR